MDGVPVYESRLRMGAALARKIMREHPNHGIDVVIAAAAEFFFKNKNSLRPKHTRNSVRERADDSKQGSKRTEV
jgi:hypothetical protein